MTAVGAEASGALCSWVSGSTGASGSVVPAAEIVPTVEMGRSGVRVVALVGSRQTGRKA